MEKLVMGKEVELQAVFDSRASFYKKAITRTDQTEYGTYHSLFSYGTFIIELKLLSNGELIINAMTDDPSHLTQTTLRHLNEFMLQHGMSSKPKKEWLKVQAAQMNYSI